MPGGGRHGERVGELPAFEGGCAVGGGDGGEVQQARGSGIGRVGRDVGAGEGVGVRGEEGEELGDAEEGEESHGEEGEGLREGGEVEV